MAQGVHIPTLYCNSEFQNKIWTLIETHFAAF